MAQVGIIAIGRNEGERLRRCLTSVLNRALPVVYVDSKSTDGSAELARSMGADVVDLDMSLPFSAARARNEGFERLMRVAPGLKFVQFVDGDCEVVDGWWPVAQAFFGAHPEVAAVCGRRRERHPDSSVYNLLCDIEWNTPVGRAKACGGDALMRVAALTQVGGFRDELIAGEEPELCVRLRAANWQVWRLDADMTLHDAAMTRFGQWWRRAMRAGYAFAEGAHLHGGPPERHWVRESRSAMAWGLALPAAVLLLAALFGPAALGLLALYPLQVMRLFAGACGSARVRLARSAFLVLGKFAEAAGELRFHAQRLRHRPAGLIEYK